MGDRDPGTSSLPIGPEATASALPPPEARQPSAGVVVMLARVRPCGLAQGTTGRRRGSAWLGLGLSRRTPRRSCWDAGGPALALGTTTGPHRHGNPIGGPQELRDIILARTGIDSVPDIR